MYELTYKDGWKTLARYVEGVGWFEWDSDRQLKDDCWVWCEKVS